MAKKYDFAGLATKANMKCTDGRTILTGAFRDDDGRRVPLIWNHQHDGPENVLGHADLEYTDDGVMAYCSFNSSDNAQKAKDSLHRDDIIDITDFDVVEYQYGVMRMNLNEELAMAIMVGDGREEGDEDKISEDHIRSIWHDDELYTIHADVDLAAAKKELQGTNTGANFGENYIYAEAIVNASLYSREQYKGSGSLDFYCTPHLLNKMLLARDLKEAAKFANEIMPKRVQEEAAKIDKLPVLTQE